MGAQKKIIDQLKMPPTIFVLPLTLWDRLNAWLFLFTLVLALLLSAAFSDLYDMRIPLCTLVPQLLYPALLVDALYVSGDATIASSQRAMGTRTCFSVAVILTNAVIFATMILKHDWDFRHDQPGAFTTLLISVLALALIGIVQIAGVIIGSPFSVRTRRMLQYATAEAR